MSWLGIYGTADPQSLCRGRRLPDLFLSHLPVDIWPLLCSGPVAHPCGVRRGFLLDLARIDRYVRLVAEATSPLLRCHDAEGIHG